MLYNTLLKDVMRRIKVLKQEGPLVFNLPVGQHKNCYMVRSKREEVGQTGTLHKASVLNFFSFYKGIALHRPHVEDGRDKKLSGGKHLGLEEDHRMLWDSLCFVNCVCLQCFFEAFPSPKASEVLASVILLFNSFLFPFFPPLL